MRTNVKITLIEQHEMVCNLLIPKTLIVAPYQINKSEIIKEVIKSVDYYKIFVPNREIINIKYVGIKNVHIFKDYFTQDLDSVGYKIFVDDIELINTNKPEDKSEQIITIDSPGIYAAITSKFDFKIIQQLITVRRFDFERICIVSEI